MSSLLPPRKERAVLSITLSQLNALAFHGVDLRPNAHAWVNDSSIQEALDLGLADDTLVPHHDQTNRAARIASFVRMIDAGTLPRKLYAELYFRGTALRFKVIDGNHRWRAMQFRRDPAPVTFHVFGRYGMLRDVYPPEVFVNGNLVH